MDHANRSSHARAYNGTAQTSRFWARALLALILSFCLTTQSWAVQETVTAPAAKGPDAAQIPLPDGTPVKLRLNRTISSADASVGQPADFTVTEDVAVNGVILIPKGSAGMCKVTEAQPKRRMGRAGKLEIVLRYVRLADSETVPVRAVKDVKGKNAAVGMTVGIVATGLLFFPAAPLFLLMKGKDITIPEGADAIAYVDGDRKLEAAKFAPKTDLAATAAATAAATTSAPTTPTTAPLTSTLPANVPPETTGNLDIQSNPAAASVYVDGTFMANTPTTLHLNPGQHNLRIALEGYREWIQDLTVKTGSANHITADLERLN
jgi:hypothetical protein